MSKKTYPADITASIETARDLASTDFVNLDAGTNYLTGCHPKEFPTPKAAAAAIKGE